MTDFRDVLRKKLGDLRNRLSAIRRFMALIAPLLNNSARIVFLAACLGIDLEATKNLIGVYCQSICTLVFFLALTGIDRVLECPASEVLKLPSLRHDLVH